MFRYYQPFIKLANKLTAWSALEAHRARITYNLDNK